MLGKILVSSIDGFLTAGIIVETEAYLPQGDPACHGCRGETRSNRSMFGEAGLAYVYPIHARYCFNVVTQKCGEPTAVLIRALQPTTGLDEMISRRSTEKRLDLCRGPARLCQALGIDRTQDGHDLTHSKQLWIDEQNAVPVEPHQVKRTERIGVTSAKEMPLRFVLSGCQYVSGPKRLR